MMKEHLSHISRRSFLSNAGRAVAGFVLLSRFPLYAQTNSRQVLLRRTIFTMGAPLTIEAYGESKEHIISATSSAFESFNRLERLFSIFDPKSDIARINALAGKEPATVEEEVIELLTLAQKYCSMTGGMFDITVEPLMKLWGFRAGEKQLYEVPDDKLIRSVLDSVGIQNLVIDEKNNQVVLTKPNCSIDLGGIAIGYTVDQAVSILKKQGIESAFINHSGDAYALGSPPNESGWSIGIPNPLDPTQIIKELKIQDRAVSTSGSYEKFVDLNEAHYGHIMNPLKGAPSQTILSSTALAQSSIDADVLSTSAFSMGLDKAGDLFSNTSLTELILYDHRSGTLRENRLIDSNF